MGILHTSTLDQAMPPAFAGIVPSATALSVLELGATTATPSTASQLSGPSTSAQDYECIAAAAFGTPNSPVAGRILSVEPPFIEGPLFTHSLAVAVGRGFELLRVRRTGKTSVDPKLREFVKRIFVPALVKRYISGLKVVRPAWAAGNAL
jgi:hypothetical protein